VTGLTAGIAGAVVLAVYSSSLEPTGFLIPRTVPATAVLFSEPDTQVPRTSISRRQYSPYHSQGHEADCKRPIISLTSEKTNFQKIKKQLARSPPLVKAYNLFTEMQATHGMRQARVFDKLGIACVLPILGNYFHHLLGPVMPKIERLRCRLGLIDDGSMEAPSCNLAACNEPEIEDREITQDRGMPNMDFMRLETSTMDDCFGNMRKIQYGARVIANLVEDESCSDPRYKQICEELESQNRTVSEETCSTPRYATQTNYICKLFKFNCCVI